jgi:anhydro-N-acetylmuramic acid kinase
METKSKLQITIPNTELVDFKEALIFGFLAVLYLRQTTSCLADVTGASSNSIGGCLYY